MTASITIRPAGTADIVHIDAVLARAYPRLLAADYDTGTLDVALPMMAVTRPDLLADQSYFVAMLGDDIVGAGGWTREVPGTQDVIARRGNIRRLILDDRKVRMGIATKLMERTHKDAKLAGMQEMYVLSTRTAAPFYAALGYEYRRDVDVPLGPSGVKFPSIEMRRGLP